MVIIINPIQVNSDRAIVVNIQIIRIFTKLREMLTDTLHLKLEIEEIKKKLSSQNKNIELVFTYLDELLEKKEKPRQKIEYKKYKLLTLNMKTFQNQINIKPHGRGFHLITDTILFNLPEINKIKIGMLQVFIKHTSASLTINENVDPTVRNDFESHINRLVPENEPYYTHNYEGSDDMPAHIKTSLMGSSVQIPITNGKLNLGTWQGIYLCEHRNFGGFRSLVITAFGV